MASAKSNNIDKTKVLSTSSPIRYPGGKFRARKILEEYIPDDTTDIISPFFGGGSFELFMTEKGIRVHGSDIFWLLANFWEVLLDTPNELADELDKFVGKVDREKFRTLQSKCIELECMEHNKMTKKQRIEAARDFIIVNRCSFSGATLSGGFSADASKTRFTQSNVDKIRGFNNSLVRVSCADAFEIIRNARDVIYRVEYIDNTKNMENENGIGGTDVGAAATKYKNNKTILFLDPPYWLEEAGANTLYGISGSLHKSFDHEKLREVVIESGLPFVLTYNNSENIRELWNDCEIYDASWSYGMNKSKESKEIIIVSPDLIKAE